jgi:predicted permease
MNWKVRMLNDLLFRLRALFRRQEVESELDDELRAHFERHVEKGMSSGLSREQAARRARLQSGGYEQLKEDCRDARGVSLAENFVQDARYGLRTLRKSPAFALVAVLTLALGIGASASVFSVVNAILLKPLPYPHADRIVIPWLVAPAGVNIGAEYIPWGQVQYRTLTRASHPFQYVGAFQNDSFNLTGSGEPERFDGYRATAEFFGALGVSPVLGRVYNNEEDQPGHEFVVVLSYQLWQDRFGGSRDVLGRSIVLNGSPYTVIGVMPADFAFPRGEEMPASFSFPRHPQLWVPAAIPASPKGGPSEQAVVARLKAGLSIAQAQAQMDVLSRNFEKADPRWKGWFNTRLTPLMNQVVGDAQRPLLLILGSVGVVLLIACSNVANLLLARSFVRKREFTLRAALGAGRGRIVRQLLTESVILALTGGLLGTLLALAGVYSVKVFGPASVPRLQESALDWRVIAFSVGLSVFTGIFFGIAPALVAVRENVFASLKEGGQRSVGSGAHPNLRNGFLVAQVALALVLVVSAGLLVRTFFRLLSVDPGFRPSQVLTFDLSVPALKYPDQLHIVPLYRKVLEGLRVVPGFQSAGVAETLPMGGEGESTVINIVDHPAAKPKELPFANYTIVSPGYFGAVGASILRGRDISEADSAGAIPATVINTTMAKKYWPGQDPLGKKVALGSPRFPTWTVVGIVADIKHFSMREDTPPEMYVPFTQPQWPSMLTTHVAVRSTADTATLSAAMREAVHAVDPDLPVANLALLTTLVDQSMTQPRFAMLLLASFAGLALLLAAIGMYGVISYSVTQRTQEIGIRMALGAARTNVFRMVLAEGARLTGLGIVIGLAAALAVTQLMKSFLYGIRATDPITFVAVSALLVVVALLACYLPARRATHVDPIVALRYE